MGANHSESLPRAWAVVDLGRLRRNARMVADRAGCPIMAVVKAGAYGHGLEEVALALDPLPEVAFFGVANAGEARRLAAVGVLRPIYLLGATWEGERAEVVARGWVPCLSSLEEAAHFDQLAKEAGRPLRVHLAIDTGMGRGGFLPDGIDEVIGRLAGFRHLDIEGVGSHLSSAESDDTFTRGQIAAFEEALSRMGGAGRFRWRHLANSAGLAGYDSPSWNLVRPGLLLYGVPPACGRGPEVEPVMSLRSRVTLVRTLPAGHGISYGRTYVTTRATRVATIGIGYGDGYPLGASGAGARVSLAGGEAPILGRVTMDQLMVDVSGIPGTSVGEEVELFGDRIPVAEVARWAGTIPWEVLTRVTARVTRSYGDVADRGRD